MTGCSGGEGIAALSDGAGPEDQLPAYVLTQDLDATSVRKVIEKDGITYFISRPAQDQGFCIIRTKGRDDTAWGAACGTGTGRVITNSITGIPEAVTLVTDGYSTDDLEEEGWTKIHDNLLTR
jgi:hypothetical protein